MTFQFMAIFFTLYLICIVFLVRNIAATIELCNYFVLALMVVVLHYYGWHYILGQWNKVIIAIIQLTLSKSCSSIILAIVSWRV